MLYAQTQNKGDIPLAWEEVELLAKALGQRGGAALGYQVKWERKMFALAEGAELRVNVTKWLHDAHGTYPTTLLITDDPQMAASALRMLLVTAEDERKRLAEEGRQLWR